MSVRPGTGLFRTCVLSLAIHAAFAAASAPDLHSVPNPEDMAVAGLIVQFRPGTAQDENPAAALEMFGLTLERDWQSARTSTHSASIFPLKPREEFPKPYPVFLGSNMPS